VIALNKLGHFGSKLSLFLSSSHLIILEPLSQYMEESPESKNVQVQLEKLICYVVVLDHIHYKT
jgi:hypothetical protein